MRIFRFAILLAATVLLAACANHRRNTLLEQTLSGYAAEVRWGNIAATTSYMDPEQLAEHPPSELQLKRFEHVRVSGYDELGSQRISDTEFRQKVKIGLINIHSQHERHVVDQQVWRYDPTAERWLLESGLPEIVADQE